MKVLSERFSAAKMDDERNAIVSEAHADTDLELSFDELGSVSGGSDKGNVIDNNKKKAQSVDILDDMQDHGICFRAPCAF